MRRLFIIAALVVSVIVVAVAVLYLISPFPSVSFTCKAVEVTDEYVKLAIWPANSAEIVTNIPAITRTGIYMWI